MTILDDSCGCPAHLAQHKKTVDVPGMTMTLEQKVARLRLVADGLRRIQEFESARYLDEYATHLTQPAQSVDVAKVREVITHLRSFRSNTPPTWAHLDDAADKLEAALQELKP